MGDPVLHLRDKLLADRAAGAKGRMAKGYLFAFFIKAWNLRRAGRTISRLQFKMSGQHPEAFPDVNGLARTL